VHTLVLEAFVGPCLPGMECCHRDGNPANNRLDNLRWDTRAANRRDMLRHGTHRNARLFEADIPDIVALIEGGVMQSEVAKYYKVSTSTINAIWLGDAWSHITGRGGSA
jgi:hypothetical protein